MRQHQASLLLQNSPLDFISGLTGRPYDLCEAANITPKTETGKYTLTPIHDTRLNVRLSAWHLLLPAYNLFYLPKVSTKLRGCVYCTFATEVTYLLTLKLNKNGVHRATDGAPCLLLLFLTFWCLQQHRVQPLHLVVFLLQEVIKQKIGHVELRAHIMLQETKCVLIFVQAVIILSTSYYSAPRTGFPFPNILWTSSILFTWGPSKCLKCLIHHQT